MPRWSALLLAALALAGCGFHPLYGERAGAADEPALATIRVMPIQDRIGQELELSLREALNPSGRSVESQYTLMVTLAESHVDLGIQRDASATRGREDVSATFRLIDAHGKQIFASTTQSTGAYNILNDAFAAQVAQEDARIRTVRDLADEIRLRLSLFLRQQRAGG